MKKGILIFLGIIVFLAILKEVPGLAVIMLIAAVIYFKKRKGNPNVEHTKEPYHKIPQYHQSTGDKRVSGRLDYLRHQTPDFDSYVVLDFETTGLSPRTDRIIEIGAIKIKNGEIVEEFNTLVNPQIRIPSKITKITGITDTMVKGKPFINTAIKDLLNFISDFPIVAHNASFDMGFLLNNIEQPLSNPVIDTLQLCRKFFSFDNNKLSTVCEQLDIDNKSHHRALNDCIATSEIYKHCKIRYEVDTANIKAAALEKEEKIEEAVKLYELSIANNFDGNHPYDRLAIYYRKLKDYDNEIRVLNKAIYVFENVVYTGRSDRLPKLEKFRDRLAKVEALKTKATS